MPFALRRVTAAPNSVNRWQTAISKCFRAPKCTAAAPSPAVVWQRWLHNYGIDYDPMSMMGMMQGGMDATPEASSTGETTMMPMDMPMSGMMVVRMGLEG